ncbi:MAG: 1,4-dihydroxy-2-naphthoyl-CoA hydrolase [Cyclobacteriaceae bacterium]|jgi:1,4-dihydroxy-2-naphthoyl-CoA hydrolase
MIPENVDLHSLQEMGRDSMVEFLEIEFTEIGKDYLVAKMPVNQKTRQPFGLLHGGASVVLAETLGSIASNLVLAGKQIAVGLEVNANHIRSVKEGFVFGTARPIHLGKKTHVWSIEIKDEYNNMICISRLTIAVIDNK